MNIQDNNIDQQIEGLLKEKERIESTRMTFYQSVQCGLSKHEHKKQLFKNIYNPISIICGKIEKLKELKSTIYNPIPIGIEKEFFCFKPTPFIQ